MIFPNGINQILAVAGVFLVLQIGSASRTGFGGDLRVGHVKTMEALADVPTVVTAFFDDVDLFPRFWPTSAA